MKCTVTKLSETLALADCHAGEDKGFWLYDEICGMNLAMRAESERVALVAAWKDTRKASGTHTGIVLAGYSVTDTAQALIKLVHSSDSR